VLQVDDPDYKETTQVFAVEAAMGGPKWEIEGYQAKGGKSDGCSNTRGKYRYNGGSENTLSGG
jgi:hypothetical protein